jgi:hypothetical protein
MKIKELKPIPASRVRDLCAQIAEILDSTEFTNSQKIAKMRIANRELAEEAA